MKPWAGHELYSDHGVASALMESTSQRPGGDPLVLARLVIQPVTNRKVCRVYGKKLPV